MVDQEQEFSMNDVLFVALVRDFESMAWVGFGKILDPVSQKAERNLDRAKVAIDMLGMLEQKTKGNLDGEQAALLQQVLTNLRLNYVDEMQKQDAEKKGESAGESQDSQPRASGDKTAESEAAGAEEPVTRTSSSTEGEPAGGPDPAKKGAEPKSKSRAKTGGKTQGGGGGAKK
jgi:hypothetical protein